MSRIGHLLLAPAVRLSRFVVCVLAVFTVANVVVATVEPARESTWIWLSLRGVTPLVRAAQRGDREAFGQLVVRFERTVFAIALRRLGDYNEAEELCQDVFLQAITKIHQLRRPECFGGWLRSITHRLAINRRVRRAPAVPIEPEALQTRCVEEATPLSAE